MRETHSPCVNLILKNHRPDTYFRLEALYWTPFIRAAPDLSVVWGRGASRATFFDRLFVLRRLAPPATNSKRETTILAGLNWARRAALTPGRRC